MVIANVLNVHEAQLGHLLFGLSMVEAQFVFLFCSRLISRALSRPVSELSSHRFLQRDLTWNKIKYKLVSKSSIKTSNALH